MVEFVVEVEELKKLEEDFVNGRLFAVGEEQLEFDPSKIEDVKEFYPSDVVCDPNYQR